MVEIPLRTRSKGSARRDILEFLKRIMNGSCFLKVAEKGLFDILEELD
jgi:hypothetical protein